MKDLDNNLATDNLHLHDDEDLLMDHVINEEHDLLYLDTYLKEIFAK